MRKLNNKKLIKNLLREGLDNNNRCDCCDYFDMSSLNDYVEIEKPLYSIVSKRRTAIIEYLNPKQYIYRIAKGFGISYDETLGGAYDENRAKSYAERMRNGEKAPIGYYPHDGASQEGRHRAMAAMINNCDKIPVVKIKHLNNDEFLKIVKFLNGMSYDEVNDRFIEMGYPNGITRLGYNDLTRYIDYNL